MSTAFFHEFGEELSDGLDLASDVLDHIFADPLGGPRSRNCPGGSSRSYGLDPSGIDEFTGNSLGDIDNHALLADNIGVDIVGRSSGSDTDGRVMGPPPTYIQSPLGDGLLRTNGSAPVSMMPAGSLTGKAIDSFLVLSQDSTCMPSFHGGPLTSSSAPFRDLTTLSSSSTDSMKTLGPTVHSHRYFPGSTAYAAGCGPNLLTGAHSSACGEGIDASLSKLPLVTSVTSCPSLGQQFLTSISCHSAPVSVGNAVPCRRKDLPSPGALRLSLETLPAKTLSSPVATSAAITSSPITSSSGTSVLLPSDPAVAFQTPGADKAKKNASPAQDLSKPKKKRAPRNRTRTKPYEPAKVDDSKVSSPRGGWPKGKPRSSKRQAGEPRPVVSSWQIFLSDQFKNSETTQSGQTGQSGETQKTEKHLTKSIKTLAAKWQSLPEAEKRVYETRAAEDKARYMKELEEFQKTSNYAQLLEKRVKEHFGAGDQAMPPEMLERLKSSAEIQNTKDLYCVLCQQTFTTQHNHQEHLVGKKHLQNVKKNFEQLAQATSVPPPAADDASISSHADQFMLNFFNSNRERDLEIQELKTRQTISQMKTKKLQDVISGLETRKTVTPQRTKVLDDRNKLLLAQLNGFSSLVSAFTNWRSTKSCVGLMSATSSPASSSGSSAPCPAPVLQSSTAVGNFPTTPGTPIPSPLEVMLQKSINAFPSPPSSDASSCSSVSSSGIDMAALGFCKSPPLVAAAERHWAGMNCESNRDTDQAAAAALSLENALTPGTLRGNEVCTGNSLSGSMFNLAPAAAAAASGNGMDPSLALSGEKVNPLLMPGETSAPGMSGVLPWENWLT